MVEHVYRAVVLISLNQGKADGLAREGAEVLRRRVTDLAAELRRQRGVRHVEAVLYADWRDDLNEFKDWKKQPPWRPRGALVFLEDKDEGQLSKNIDAIYGVAKKFDQTLMRLTPIDGW